MAAYDTRSTEGLMSMFYNSAMERNSVESMERGGIQIQMMRLTAKQFAWLKSVEMKESGFVSKVRGYFTVTAEIKGVGFADAIEQMHGSAIVTIRLY